MRYRRPTTAMKRVPTQARYPRSHGLRMANKMLHYEATILGSPARIGTARHAQEAVRPSRGDQCRLALLVGSEPLLELSHRESPLKLHSIHRFSPPELVSPSSPSTGSPGELHRAGLSFVANQVTFARPTREKLVWFWSSTGAKLRQPARDLRVFKGTPRGIEFNPLELA